MTDALINARRDLLSQCVVRVDGERLGTGVFVSANEILTATHVVGREQSSADVTWQDRTVSCEVVEHVATGEQPIADLSPWPDLTLLRVPAGEFSQHPCVRLGPDEAGRNGPALTYGHPREGSSIQLSTRTLAYRGGHARRTHDAFYYDGFKGDDIDAGFSGAPLLQGRCVDHVIVATRDPTTDKGCLAIRLSELVQLEGLRSRNVDFHRSDARWADAEPRSRRLWAAAATGVVVAAAAILLVVWPNPPTPDLTVPRGVLGIGVAPVENAPDVAELIQTALEDLGNDEMLRHTLVECGITPSPLQVVGAEALGDVPPTEDNDWLNLSALVYANAAPGVSESERRVSAEVDFLARPIRSGMDPILFADLTLEPAIIDIDDNRSAFERFPELRVLPTVIAGLVELNESSLEALAAGRCAFIAATEAIQDEDSPPRVREFRAALHVLIAITWIREESLVPGGGEASCAASASPLECAQRSLDAARAEDPSDKTDALIAANETGVKFLELLADDGKLFEGVTPADARDAAAQFVEVGQTSGQSPAGFVLTSTLAAKTLLAAAIDLTNDAQNCAADPEPAAFLDDAEQLARKATEITDSTVDIYRADAFATLGILAIERCDPTAAAAAFGTAADLARGIPRQELRLQQASVLALVGGPEADAQVSAILDGVEVFLNASPDPGLACSFNMAIDNLDPGRPPRVECPGS